jgi:hypothetical protein
MPVPCVAKTQVSAARAWRNDNGHRRNFLQQKRIYLRLRRAHSWRVHIANFILMWGAIRKCMRECQVMGWP